jgi:hypothetical protein
MAAIFFLMLGFKHSEEKERSLHFINLFLSLHGLYTGGIKPSSDTANTNNVPNRPRVAFVQFPSSELISLTSLSIFKS